MKYPKNIQEVASLQPDYLGFIFYDASPRNCVTALPILPTTIKKVGVFVNADLETITKKVSDYQLDAIQLHGKESATMCQALKDTSIDVIKVFSVDTHFDFQSIVDYENVCDYFLFDTKGQQHGGNGFTFDWDILKNYPSDKPYFLSGGIGINELEALKDFLKTDVGQKCYAIDVNSKFEIDAGLKDVERCRELIDKLGDG
ncbi:phosphoribosylanthranilate isomerase [Flavobacterium covae]|uniref:phosphoribosylanthranilate isomerase n=1 Tax=Flavobacterium covae TaxID=2906076 RepID=UPI003392B9F1